MKKNRFLLLFAFVLFILFPFNVNAMQIFIEQPDGENISLEVESSDTIEAVKVEIFNINNAFLVGKQRLYFNGIELTNGRTLADYSGLGAGSVIKLETDKVKIIFSANGGLFANNKEQYTIEDYYRGNWEMMYPTREGYAFKGYYTEKNGGTKFEMILNESGIDSDMTFYAQWEKNSVVFPSNPENPQTFDGIGSSIIIGTISLIGLIVTTIYFKKRNKVRA